jgi:hypothetical protein
MPKPEASERHIVKVVNERGIVLCGALVMERIMPVSFLLTRARTDIIIPGKLDRGGAINLITPKGLTSRHAGCQATTSFLVEVQRVSMEEMDKWRRDIPKLSIVSMIWLRLKATPGLKGGQIMGKKVFLIDNTICNGCYSCQIGCKDEHVGNDCHL